MMITVQSNCIKVCWHSSKGRMIITTQPIQSGETLEIAPVLTLSGKTTDIEEYDRHLEFDD